MVVKILIIQQRVTNARVAHYVKFFNFNFHFVLCVKVNILVILCKHKTEYE